MITRAAVSLILLATTLLILAVGLTSARAHRDVPNTPSVVTTLGTQGP
jgi:hypothetical protein